MGLARGPCPCDLVDMMQNAPSSCHSKLLNSNCKYSIVTRQNETVLTLSLSLHQRRCSAESLSKTGANSASVSYSQAHQQGRCSLSWQLKPPCLTTISKIMTPPLCS